MKLKILPENIIKDFNKSASLKDLLSDIQISITYPCGGSGTCGKCRIQFIEDATEPSYADSVYFTTAELHKGHRLACTSTLLSSATIKIPKTSRVERITVLSASKNRPLILNPFVIKQGLNKKLADINNLESDEEIILRNFHHSVKISNQTLVKLPSVLRDSASVLTSILAGNEIIDLEAGEISDQLFGCAVDLGTTTVVIGLYDLTTGQTVGIDSVLNPQNEFGEDLISRISYINNQNDRVLQLQSMVLQCVNRSVDYLCQQNNISSKWIYQVVVAGNAAQNHIFCGINPFTLSVAPYTPVFKQLRNLRAEDIGLHTFPEASVWMLPNLGGFVGGDVVADMLIAGFFGRRTGTSLLLDIGTNCEVVLRHQGVVYAASSPAGPAMEGASISCGMRAEPGAIYDIRVHDDNINVMTIDNQPARGICGSGLFHIIAKAVEQGWIGADGRVKKEIKLSSESADGLKISLTQADVREFQLAKAAIVAAWKTLCTDAGADIKHIENVYIAGAFGNFIQPAIALKLGLVPSIDLSNIHFIGNASLAGARMALLNKHYLNRSNIVSQNVRFVELAGRLDFQDKYIENMNLEFEAEL
jgi:uncharacterized 2Fe-2S/4Fe-4S cluster protein (DUF4445 family)